MSDRLEAADHDAAASNEPYACAAQLVDRDAVLVAQPSDRLGRTALWAAKLKPSLPAARERFFARQLSGL
jgi:hypothetical protein